MNHMLPAVAVQTMSLEQSELEMNMNQLQAEVNKLVQRREEVSRGGRGKRTGTHLWSCDSSGSGMQFGTGALW